MASSQQLFSDDEGGQSPRVPRRRQFRERSPTSKGQTTRKCKPTPNGSSPDDALKVFIDSQDDNAEYHYDEKKHLFYYRDEKDGLYYDIDDGEQDRLSELYLAGGLTALRPGGDSTKKAAKSASSDATLSQRDRPPGKGRGSVVTTQPSSSGGDAAAGAQTSRPWKNSLFSCCSNMDTCLVGWCAPCLLSKEIEEKVNDPSRTHGLWMLSAVDSPLAASGLAYLTDGMSIVASFIDCFMLCQQRASFRRRYGIATDTAAASDYCAVLFCKSCVRIQMANELRYIEESQPKRAV